ncbi:uncharacterized protein F5147DRAFT_722252 [Suillus discolor]|uniref:Uncharacterized protein n=1 Tax=Suillus discolor TaxID=1912936 RepID=A0A9P7JNF4_9AGAM|nr:uncharacterized protein F5147DRAFT_722252 [Suillus discolor]KAG2092499.1 hypothetical protein F5147DRAFT_722252 [Suillus discolor]
MANIIRSPKSCGKWDDNELIAYNITVTAVPSQQFFPQGTDVPLTAAGLDPALATADSYSISDFACQLLITLGFEEHRYRVCRRLEIPLEICDDIRKFAEISLGLQDLGSTEMVPLLQMNKTQIGRSNVEAHMISAAIAAYQFNNSMRQEKGLHPLDAMTMPLPLSDAVISCQYPSARTEVLKCEVASDCKGGMEALEYRLVALQYYVAFKSLAKSHWEKFIP